MNIPDGRIAAFTPTPRETDGTCRALANLLDVLHKYGFMGRSTPNFQSVQDLAELDRYLDDRNPNLREQVSDLKHDLEELQDSVSRAISELY